MANKQSKSLLSLPVVLAAALAIAIGAGVWYLERGPAPEAKGPVLTADAKGYVKNLKLSDVEMKKTDAAMNISVVEIVGAIKNDGDRALKSVLLTCIFYDPYGQVVLKDRVEIVRAKTGGIQPGETKPFRLAFDTLPASWNQSMPQLVIAEIVFG
ncbi:MAG: hypothetical protein JNK48_30915 [Bryobacterales bacterium]|nr:hypothetical protein [Bryobacterales bacterium]